MDIGKRIRDIREARKLTQEQVAKIIVLDNSSYARIEKKGNRISIEQLEKIADALGVSVIELLTGEEQKVQDSEEVEKLKAEVARLKSALKDSRRVTALYQGFLKQKIESNNKFDVQIKKILLVEINRLEGKKANMDKGTNELEALQDQIDSYKGMVEFIEKSFEFENRFIETLIKDAISASEDSE